MIEITKAIDGPKNKSTNTKTDMFCAKLYNSVFVRVNDNGYHDRVCCNMKSATSYVSTINEIINSKDVLLAREQLAKDIWPDICSPCKVSEDAGLPSPRIAYNNQYGYDKSNSITYWDIRPDNTCNLKCVMCNISWSSKWAEDIDIFNEFSASTYTGVPINRNKVNWDYIYDNTVNQAKGINFAGGEPFYMKNVIKFMERLSENEWNRENTEMRFITNGISFTDKVWKILNKFKKVHMTFSVEGYGEVNEYIRFPMNWELWYNNFTKILFDTPIRATLNITVGALNYAVTQEAFNKFSSLHPRLKNRIHMNPLYAPDQLSLNALKPDVVKQVYDNCEHKFLKNMYATYEYNEKLNDKMKRFLSALDDKRKTNSKQVLPWCWE